MSKPDWFVSFRRGTLNDGGSTPDPWPTDWDWYVRGLWCAVYRKHPQNFLPDMWYFLVTLNKRRMGMMLVESLGRVISLLTRNRSTIVSSDELGYIKTVWLGKLQYHESELRQPWLSWGGVSHAS